MTVCHHRASIILEKSAEHGTSPLVCSVDCENLDAHVGFLSSVHSNLDANLKIL